jgi:hypothetical protein
VASVVVDNADGSNDDICHGAKGWQYFIEMFCVLHVKNVLEDNIEDNIFIKNFLG